MQVLLPDLAPALYSSLASGPHCDGLLLLIFAIHVFLHETALALILTVMQVRTHYRVDYRMQLVLICNLAMSFIICWFNW